MIFVFIICITHNSAFVMFLLVVEPNLGLFHRGLNFYRRYLKFLIGSRRIEVLLDHANHV